MGFDPASIALVTAGIGAVSAGVGVYGAYQQAQGQKQQGEAAQQQGIAQQQSADYQAQVSRNNKLIADENVAMTESAGAAKEAIQGMKTRAAVGETKAAQGASGVDVNSGSNVGVREAEGKLGALDALTIRSNTAREAYGYEVAGVSDTAQADLLEQQGRQALIAGQTGKKAGEVSALGTYLNGASSVGGKFANLLQNTGGKTPAASTAPSGAGDVASNIWPP